MGGWMFICGDPEKIADVFHKYDMCDTLSRSVYHSPVLMCWKSYRYYVQCIMY